MTVLVPAGHGAAGARSDGARVVRRAVRAPADAVVQPSAAGQPGAGVVPRRPPAARLRLQVGRVGRCVCGGRGSCHTHERI